jgi:LPXTG-motif cell wall-anchored protein
MRALTSVGAAALAVSATLLAAPVAFADAPGDNGTIKIHDAKTGEALEKDEPHVCSFYLDAFGFDSQQQATWKIVDQPPTGTDDVVAGHGSITLDDTGHGRTDDMTLADGHYKLQWNFDAEHGAGKHKVFWVDCGGDNSTTTGETTTGGGDPQGTTGATTGQTTSGGDTSGTTGATTTGGTTGTTGTTGSAAAAGGSASGTPSATPSTDTSGSLAETGTSVTGLSALAAVLLAAGGTILFRRRSSSRH